MKKWWDVFGDKNILVLQIGRWNSETSNELKVLLKPAEVLGGDVRVNLTVETTYQQNHKKLEE